MRELNAGMFRTRNEPLFIINAQGTIEVRNFNKLHYGLIGGVLGGATLGLGSGLVMPLAAYFAVILGLAGIIAGFLVGWALQTIVHRLGVSCLSNDPALNHPVLIEMPVVMRNG